MHIYHSPNHAGKRVPLDLSILLVSLIVLLCALPAPDNSAAEGDAAVWGKKKSELEEMLGEKYRVTETEHFHLESFLGPKEADRSAELCEKAYAFCLKLFCLEKKEEEKKPDKEKKKKQEKEEESEDSEYDDEADEDENDYEEEDDEDRPAFWEGKSKIFFIKSKESYGKYVDIVAEGWSDMEKKMTKELMGFYFYTPPTSVGCYENANQDVTTLQHGAVHQVGHFCLFYFDSPTEVPLWLNEGFASFVESSIMGLVYSRCVGGGTGGHDPHRWEDSREWEVQLKELVAKKKDTPISTLINRRDFASMTIPDRAKSWSLVKYMVDKDKAKFVSFVRALKVGTKQEKALQDSFGLTFEELEKKWKKYLFEKRRPR